jgi:hypothetical protein
VQDDRGRGVALCLLYLHAVLRKVFLLKQDLTKRSDSVPVL